MNHHLGSGDGERSPIEVKISEEAGMGRESWLPSRGAQVIKSKITLRKEVVPGIEGKSRVCRSEPRDEVVLPGLDSTFGCIATM